MEAINITPLGIVRKTTDNNSVDGACAEIVNMRFKDGAWRSLTPKQKINPSELSIFDNASDFYIHRIREDKYIIAFDSVSNTIAAYDIVSGSIDQTIMSMPSGETLVEINGYGRFLIITTTMNKYVFNYDFDTLLYNLMPVVPEGSISFGDVATLVDYVYLGDVGSVENAIAATRQRIFTDGQKGLFEGHAYFRVAWELFDGTFILHSPVHYYHIGLSTSTYLVKQMSSTDFRIRYYNVGKPVINFVFSADQITSLLKYKDIIRNLVVFMSKPIRNRDAQNEYPDLWEDVTDFGITGTMPQINIQAADSFKNTKAFYRVETIPLIDITEERYTSKTITVENVETLETREALPIDSFTSHTIFGAVSKDYNGRLHLEDVTTRLLNAYNNGRYATDRPATAGDEQNEYDIIFSGYNRSVGDILDYAPWQLHFEVEFETDYGERLTRRTAGTNISFWDGVTLFISGANLNMVMKEVLAYPDTRAKRINVCLTNGNVYYLVATYELTPHDVFNLAYHISTLENDIAVSNGHLPPHIISLNSTGISADDKVVVKTSVDFELNTVAQKAPLDTEINDTNNHFNNTATNYNYTAFADGYYEFRFRFEGGSTVSERAEVVFVAAFYKNGVLAQTANYSLKSSPIGDDLLYATNLLTGDIIDVRVHVTDYPDGTVTLYQQSRFGCEIYPLSGAIVIPGDPFTLREVNDLVRDSNRLQVSMLNNIFLYPAENSYRIGSRNNTLTGMAVMSEPMSVGQFGQFPLHIFSHEGISNLNQGQGDILYLNIAPLNNDRVNGQDRILELGLGVIYATDYGLFLLQGTQRTEISQDIEGKYTIPIASLSQYTDTLIKHNYTNMISIQSFTDYLSGAAMAFDPANMEIIVSNFRKAYSYVFSLINKHWSKVAVSYAAFVRGVSGVYGIENGLTRVVNIQLESTTTTTSLVHFMITRPIKLGSNGLKRIERLIMRSYSKIPAANTGSVYVFGSLDGVSWKFIRGITLQAGETNDAIIKRLGISVRYIIIVYTAPNLTSSISTYPLTMSNLISELNGFNAHAEGNYTGKLR